MSIVPRLAPVLAALPFQVVHPVHGLPAEPIIFNNTAIPLGSSVPTGQGQPYRVPGTQTTLLFSDFGQELQSGLARQFFREAINAVKQMVTTRGDEPIDGGKYVLDRFGLKITILDGQCYPALEYSMSNEILLESLKGLNYFMIEEKFGYYAAVFDVRIPDPLGQEDVVGHAVMQSSNDGSGVEGIDVCIPAGSTE